jgi:tRNA pseudouridine32 synthase / 23S rRNA pseudouridine746 synthase
MPFPHGLQLLQFGFIGGAALGGFRQRTLRGSAQRLCGFGWLFSVVHSCFLASQRLRIKPPCNGIPMAIISADALAARILHRDANVIVLDKPAGIAVHAGRGEGPNLEALFGALRFGSDRAPALAHRLDKDTSGCLALGRHREALARLGLLFRNGYAEKHYLAVVLGTPPDSGTIDAPLSRASDDRRSWVMRTSPDGDAAITDFRLLAQGDGVATVLFTPRTGRTHQIRVHAAAAGFPLAGDRLYGGDRALAASRHLQLHAWRLTLPYDRREPIRTEAPLPQHMLPLLGLCGFTPAAAGGPPLPQQGK